MLIVSRSEKVGGIDLGDQRDASPYLMAPCLQLSSDADHLATLTGVRKWHEQHARAISHVT